jgi:lipopolysaccharide/colanic/teichoic acid biosynthesis glycosyltransferase
MAAQAVYSNLIGLVLLVVLWPFLISAAIAARIAAGPGPLFERIECAGFQGVPFFRRAFRVKRAFTGKLTMIGGWLVRLRLSGLPQLISLVRGEMGLFGPQPARLIFKDYLDRSSPVFSRRLLVKPGIFGWTQAQGHSVRNSSGIGAHLQEESAKLAYDLYYLDFGSPLLDLEILGRTLLRPFLSSRSS